MPRPELCSARLHLATAVIDAMSVSYRAKASYDLAVKQNDIVERAAALSSARGKQKEAERALADHIEQHCCFGPVR